MGDGCDYVGFDLVGLLDLDFAWVIVCKCAPCSSLWAGCLVRVWVCVAFGGLRCLVGLLAGVLLRLQFDLVVIVVLGFLADVWVGLLR